MSSITQPPTSTSALPTTLPPGTSTRRTFATTIAEADIPCFNSTAYADSGYDTNRLYSFYVRNAIGFDVDVYFRGGAASLASEACIYRGGPPNSTIRDQAVVNVLQVTVGQIYVVRPTGDNATNLAALVYTPDLSLNADRPWTINSDTLGKVIQRQLSATTTTTTSPTNGSNPSDSGSGASSVPYIVAAVVGALGIFAAIAVIAIIFYRRKKKADKAAADAAKKPEDGSIPMYATGSATLRSNAGDAPGSVSGTYGRNQKNGQRYSILWWQQNQPAIQEEAENGPEPGTRLRVIYPHRRDLEDELMLYPGDAVVMIESYGDGWCLVRVVRSRRQHDGASAVGEEGMMPLGCLDTVPDRSLGRGTGGRQGGAAAKYEDDSYWKKGDEALSPTSSKPAPKNSKRVKSLQRPESIALFQAAGRDISQYYK
ncbi:hypothetical protein HDU96_005769 [Phlyctochytrium bullatum]|nr:hypothetical protein HDU96_005769 [Phlyctochytrium bullatum]